MSPWRKRSPIGAPLILVILGSLTFLYVFWLVLALISEGNVDKANRDSEDYSDFQPKSENKEKSFMQLALDSKTSKVTDVQYQCMYEEGLAPYRHVRGLKLLEIGLGCGMWYGPGASFTLWSSYFEDVQIYIAEFEKSCGEKWYDEIVEQRAKSRGIFAHKRVRLPIMSYGDQTDRSFLKQMADQHGPWDIIIDDGCHAAKCQMSAFQNLFTELSPGGTYFLEDLVAWNNHIFENATVNMLGDLFADSASQKYAKEFFIKNPKMASKFGKLTCCDSICSVQTRKRR